MKIHEFTKFEIATYLRDYNRLIMYASSNQDVPLYDLFRHHMINDKRIQYSTKDYYYEMLSIYEFLLTSKFLTMLYDNYFDNLLEDKIDLFNIPENIFVNPNDRKQFTSKRKIISYIRNAFNHNDNPNHDLLRFIRINENGKDEIKVEILLKNTKPIPFHVIIDAKQLIKICFEIKNSSTILIASNRSTKPVSLNSFNVSETLDNIYLRRFYSKNKLSDEQISTINDYIRNNKETKNFESVLLENGMSYKDYRYSAAQKVKVEEDLKYWEDLGISGNDVIDHLLGKVMPFSFLKGRVYTINLILSDFYIRDGKKSIFDLIQDAKKIFNEKTIDENSTLYLYAKSFGIDENILYDAVDFENIISLTNAIYYGFLFDSLVMDQDIIINESKKVERVKLRDSFVHMRWFKGVKECFKLYDWKYGMDNEYNESSKDFWKTNIRFIDMEKCAEKYFQSIIKNYKDDNYMNLPIHLKKDDPSNKSSDVSSISFIRNGSFYYLNILDDEDDYNLLVCDESQIQRPADEEEKRIFINELDNLSEKEKLDYSKLIENIKDNLLQDNKSVHL